MKKGIISFLLLSLLLTGCNHNKKKQTETETDSSEDTSSLITDTYSETDTDTETDTESESETETITDPYYKDVDTSSSSALNASLQTLMFNTHSLYTSYGDIRYLFGYSDKDPKNPGNILCFYSRESLSAEWDPNNNYNREHVWPKANSNGLFKATDNSYKGAGSDLHHVRPVKTSINSDRGNTKFGSYIPADEVKGDCARIIMYLYVHYSTEIKDGSGRNRDKYAGALSLGSVFTGLSVIYQWNQLDPVDELERNRNEYVYNKQGNKNPFIDHPEWVNISLGL